MEKIAGRNRLLQRAKESAAVPGSPVAAAEPGDADSVVKRGQMLFGSPKLSNAVATPPRSVAETPNRGRRVDGARDPIKVFLRIRPLKEDEKEAGEVKCMEVQNEGAVVIRPPKDARYGATDEATYTFTRVFDTDTTQQQLYEGTAVPLVESFLSGQNGLLFAYGNTNAGKTYTIQGTKTEPGLLPRILETIFMSLPSSDKNKAGSVCTMDPNYRYALWASYLEIYNENIFDLLSEEKGQTNLAMKEDKNGHVFVKDLAEKPMASVAEALNIMALGAKNRQVAMTQINQDSSRSHSVFTIKLVRVPKDKDKEAIQKDPTCIRYHKLSIVDLAGSERAKKTQNDGARLKEAANINTSLMTFGRCLEILRWNQQHPKQPQQIVPFRESKLTRLFQDYFVGNGRAVMIVNANPAISNYAETSHVLQFSSIAREITTSTKIDTGLAHRNAKKRVGEDDPAPIDPQEKAELLAQIADLQQRLQLSESALVQLESEIRNEVSAEMGEHLQEMKTMYETCKQQELALMEDKYEKKIALLNKMVQTKNEEAPEAGPGNAEYNKLKEKYEKLVADLEAAESDKKGGRGKAAPPCKDCVAHKAKIDLMNSLMEGLEVKKAEELAYERRKAAESMADDRKQLESNYKIEISTLKAALETSRKEVETLSARVAELTQRLASVPQSPPRKVLHHEAPAEAEPTDVKVVRAPPGKAELMDAKSKKPRYDQYEAAQRLPSPPHEPATAIWKGSVQPSITGDGVSVQFTEKAVMEKKTGPFVLSPVKLMSPSKAADHHASPALDRSVSHKDLKELMAENTATGFEEVPLDMVRRVSKNISKSGLLPTLLKGKKAAKEVEAARKREEEEKKKAEKAKKEAEEKAAKELEKAQKAAEKEKSKQKGKKEDKAKDEKKDEKKEELLRKLNIKNPTAAAAAIRSPDHLPSGKDTLLGRGKKFLNKMVHEGGSPVQAAANPAVRRAAAQQAVRMSDIMGEKENSPSRRNSSINGSDSDASVGELKGKNRNALKRASDESADEGHDAKKAKGEELAAGPTRTPLMNRLRVRDSRPPGKH